MYVLEKKSTWHNPMCYWVENAIDDIQNRLSDLEDLAGLFAVWTCNSLEEAKPDCDNEYQQAIYNAVKNYWDAGNDFPATVVAYPSRKAEDTYEVWTPAEAADVKKWESFLHEWTSYSNAYDYGIHPYYFDDNDAAKEWLDWSDADVAAAIAKAADLKPYVVRDREAGNVIDEFNTLEEAKGTVIEYEDEDRNNGDYTPDFYEIYNKLTEKIVD